MNHEVYLSTAIKAAKKAGTYIKKVYEREGQVSFSYKDPHNIVTKTDIESEKIIIEIIQSKFPDHSIFSEEKGSIENGSEYLWIIDPLDGTTNFINKFPHFDVSVALVHKNELLLGAVLQPMTNELFTAQKGKGSWLNGKKIRMSACRNIAKAVVTLTRGATKTEKIRGAKLVNLLASHIRSIRMLGAASLDFCYVASGTFDAMIANGCFVQDCAAASLIAKEAGAMVTDFTGKPWAFSMKPSDLVVSNPKLHTQLVSILKDI